MNDDLFDLVKMAQDGDREALNEIIKIFSPAIRSARKKTSWDKRDDLEQTILETIIIKIKSYNLSEVPNFSTFCKSQNFQISFKSNECPYQQSR